MAMRAVGHFLQGASGRGVGPAFAAYIRLAFGVVPGRLAVAAISSIRFSFATGVDSGRLAVVPCLVVLVRHTAPALLN